MAHNGNITPIGELDQLLTPNSRAALRGDTDSERYFRYLVQNIRDSNDEVGAVRDAVARLAQRFPTASLNALLLTGTHLFAVHINSHATPPPALKGLGIAAERLRHTDDQYFGMDFRRVDAQTQIISSGISPVGWSDIPLDALGVLDLATNELTWTRETATSVAGAMGWTVTAEIIEWHGPAPYYFLPLDEDDSADFKIEAAGLEYWGQVAVIVTIGDTTFKTAVFPKDGRYLVPLRAAIRQAEGLELGAEITAIVQLDRDRKTR